MIDNQYITGVYLRAYMQYIFKLLVMALVLWAPTVQSEVIKNICVTHIDDIFRYLPDILPGHGSTIAIFDWNQKE